ncbi:MAG: 50S ribosome-binding GTPase [Candidatus ainarchaeum sp.]|nr:50S ribosome-binding GTPase [Candidatus ainarchaeum sp.]
MPTNVHPEFIAAQAQYDNAQTDDEKLKALEAMKSTWPTHKGAEKLRAEIAGKIKKMKEKIKTLKSSKKTTTTAYNIKKDGAAQVVIAGKTNSGKSTLLSKLTNATPTIAHYEFTTDEPEIGMIKYEDENIQLVELPAIIPGTSEGKARGREKLGIIRNADLLLITMKISKIENFEKEFNFIYEELKKGKILPVGSEKRVLLTRTNKKVSFEGLEKVSGEEEDKTATINYIKRHYNNLHIKILETINTQTLIEILNTRYIPTVLFVRGEDIKHFEVKNYQHIKAILINDFYLLENEQIEKIKKIIIEDTGKIVVYTRKPGEDTKQLLIIDKDSVIGDVCHRLHKDIAKNFKFAKIWGSKVKFPGQIASKEYILNNNDIIEIYSKK